MRCTWAQERLLLYLAEELGGHEVNQVRAHLQQCAVCTAQLRELTEIQQRLEPILQTQPEMSGRLEARVMDAVRDLPPPRSSWRARLILPGWRLRPLLAASALCLLFAMGVVFLRLKNSETGLPLNMVLLSEAHQQAVSGPKPPGSPTAVPKILAQELTRELHYPVTVANLQAQGARLLGGRKTEVQGTLVAQFQYEWQGTRISVFEMDAAKLAPPVPASKSFPSDSYFVAKRDGFAYVAWQNGKTNCVMVARSVPMHLLFPLACRACEQIASPAEAHGRQNVGENSPQEGIPHSSVHTQLARTNRP